MVAGSMWVDGKSPRPNTLLWYLLWFGHSTSLRDVVEFARRVVGEGSFVDSVSRLWL